MWREISTVGMDKSVSPVLQTPADINRCRRTDRHHRSGGHEVTTLGGTTTTCTQCNIVLWFSCHKSDFKNDVIVKINSQHRNDNSTSSDSICMCEEFLSQRCCGWAVDSIKIHHYCHHLHINVVVCHFGRDEIPKDCRRDTLDNLFLSHLWIPFLSMDRSWKWWLWSY